MECKHRVRIVIADNHKLFGEACKQLLEPEFEVVRIVTDGRGLVQAAIELKPDLVVLEVSIPLLNGVDAAEQIKRRCSLVKVVFTTANSDPEVVADAFRRGASAYVLKQTGAEEFLTAIRQVMRGGSYLSPLIARETIEYLLCQPHLNNLKRITRRQTEILQLLAEGKSMKQVAYILKISPGTVAFHKYKMMEILGIESNAALFQYAMTNRMAPPSGQWVIADAGGARPVEVGNRLETLGGSRRVISASASMA